MRTCQVTDTQIEEAHNQVEGLREHLLQQKVVRREAGVHRRRVSRPSASPQCFVGPNAPSEQEGDSCSESSAVLISPEDALSDGE